MTGEKKSALEDELREYLADDLPARVGRLEKRVDDIDPIARRAVHRAEDALQIAQGVSNEWNDVRDGIVRHVEEQGKAVREHVDRVTDEQNVRLEAATVEQNAKIDAVVHASARAQRDAKRHSHLLVRIAKSQKGNALERRLQIKALQTRVPLYVAIVGGIVAVIGAMVSAYVVRHGGPTMPPIHP